MLWSHAFSSGRSHFHRCAARVVSRKHPKGRGKLPKILYHLVYDVFQNMLLLIILWLLEELGALRVNGQNIPAPAPTLYVSKLAVVSWESHERWPVQVSTWKQQIPISHARIQNIVHALSLAPPTTFISDKEYIVCCLICWHDYRFIIECSCNCMRDSPWANVLEYIDQRLQSYFNTHTHTHTHTQKPFVFELRWSSTSSEKLWFWGIGVSWWIEIMSGLQYVICFACPSAPCGKKGIEQLNRFHCAEETF